MTAARRWDMVLGVASAAAWAFAAYVAGTRFLSPAAGSLIALVVLAGALGLLAARRDRTLDLVMSLSGTVAWGFATFVIVTRLLSTTAGVALGVGVAMSGLATVLATHLQETRMQRLLAGSCPRCGSAVHSEHRHRRWDPSVSRWLPPDTTWRCTACGYDHGEPWECAACPEAV